MKVLLIQGIIPHYRVPIFDELGKKVDLTIIYSQGKEPQNVSFKCIKVDTFQLRYIIHKKNLYKMAKKYDVIIGTFDLSYLYMRLLALFPHRYKLIYWGIGVSAGYNQRFDENQVIVRRLIKYIKKADAVIFYSEYPVNKYVKMGIPMEKMYVANNTVKVLPSKEEEKDSILFIGSLYKQKRIDILLNAYLNAYKKNSHIPNLILVGDGEEREKINNWILNNALESKVFLLGGIYDENKLVPLFEKAIMCISPDQAGLSVLKSMGYGVPYVTHKNAITGGEIFNIINGETGVLMENFDELETIILDSYRNKEKYITMGKNAKFYYEVNRTVDQMVSGFCKAIDYVSTSRKK